jgi:hypothetical protein
MSHTAGEARVDPIALIVIAIVAWPLISLFILLAQTANG